MWKPTCYVCGTEDIAPDADPRNATCIAHVAARQHLVSMTTEAETADGGLIAHAVATCQCGHRVRLPWGGHHEAMNALVHAHWRAVCGEAE